MAVIAAAHDLSGVGRCSLTTALAVLPALGHVCYPLPTAILSQQTGFPSYSFLDLTGHMPEYLNGWRAMGISPDMIYTGFLGNAKQAELLLGFIAEHPGASVVVDPVMGDRGELYPCFDESFAAGMRSLAASAHILLPNITEFNLLARLPPSRPLPESETEILELAREFGGPNLEYVVVTSARRGCNLLLDMAAEKVTAMDFRDNGTAYSGTGDLFASALCGLLLDEIPVADAAKLAAGFVADAAHATPPDTDTRMGAEFEPLLRQFAATAANYKEAFRDGERSQ